MTDVLSEQQRSRLMARVRRFDTSPELTVRRFLHRHGHRFRLHVAALPGRPDIVLPKLRTAIFIHGCFWHRHAGCKRTTTPATRRAFWLAKFAANMKRDKRNLAKLKLLGWRVITIWECETTPANLTLLSMRLRNRRHAAAQSRPPAVPE